MSENWKRCKGFEDRYLVSDMGRIKSLPHKGNGWKIKERSLKGLTRGYVRLCVCKNGKTFSKDLHRMVAETFIPNPGKLKYVHHINEIKSDNRVSNLEWVDHFDNIGRHYSKERKEKYGITKRKNRYRAQIKHNGKNKLVGSYKTKDEAYNAFYEEYLKIRGIPPWEN